MMATPSGIETAPTVAKTFIARWVLMFGPAGKLLMSDGKV
jgi:hypothetical protein